jgi:hypothetical protein
VTPVLEQASKLTLSKVCFVPLVTFLWMLKGFMHSHACGGQVCYYRERSKKTEMPFLPQVVGQTALSISSLCNAPFLCPGCPHTLHRLRFCKLGAVEKMIELIARPPIKRWHRCALLALSGQMPQTAIGSCPIKLYCFPQIADACMWVVCDERKIDYQPSRGDNAGSSENVEVLCTLISPCIGKA